MHTCSYCGKENEDGAFNCRECATELEAGARVKNVREAKAAAVAELGVAGGGVRSGLRRAAVAVAFLVLATLVLWQMHRETRLMAECATLRGQLAPLREENERLAQWIRTVAAAELQPLQGTWEGVELGQERQGKITLTITGNSIHFHRKTNDWYETTFTLPAGTDPQQLRATIKRCSYPDNHNLGKVVFVIFRIEDGTLTLAADQGSAETPKSFEDEEAAHYRFRKVQPQEKNAELPKSK